MKEYIVTIKSEGELRKITSCDRIISLSGKTLLVVKDESMSFTFWFKEDKETSILIEFDFIEVLKIKKDNNIIDESIEKKYEKALLKIEMLECEIERQNDLRELIVIGCRALFNETDQIRKKFGKIKDVMEEVKENRFYQDYYYAHSGTKRYDEEESE